MSKQQTANKCKNEVEETASVMSSLNKSIDRRNCEKNVCCCFHFFCSSIISSSTVLLRVLGYFHFLLGFLYGQHQIFDGLLAKRRIREPREGSRKLLYFYKTDTQCSSLSSLHASGGGCHGVCMHTIGRHGSNGGGKCHGGIGS